MRRDEYLLFLLTEKGGEEPENYNGTDDCNKKLAKTAVTGCADAEKLENPTSDSGTYYTEDEIEDAAVAT